MKFNHVIVGGTFDQFHLGHQKLIDRAFELGEKVTIGIATKNLFEKKILSQTIESYSMRKKSLNKYVQNYLRDDRPPDIISISNIYGTTLTDKSIDSIVVSKVTLKTAKEINQLRQKKGWPEMKIVVVDDVLAEDGKLITSERIRMGEIDKEGKSYWQSVIPACRQAGRNLQLKNKKLILPESMREELRRPLGKVILRLRSGQVKSKNIPMIISVGDIVTNELLKVGVEPEVKIIDFRSRRKEFSISNFQFPMNFQFPIFKKNINKPGTINIRTADRLKQLIKNAILKKQKSWLVVDGEEDLLTLPAVLFAPLHSLVLYGQMDLGAVMVEVTEKIKNKAKKLLERFI